MRSPGFDFLRPSTAIRIARVAERAARDTLRQQSAKLRAHNHARAARAESVQETCRTIQAQVRRLTVQLQDAQAAGAAASSPDPPAASPSAAASPVAARPNDSW